MSATIKYKGNTIASITTDSSKTLKTSGKYCEGDIVVENVQDGGITPSGNKAITATTSTQTGIDVTNYATVSVAPTPSETKSVTTNGDVTPSSGKLLSKVTVNVPTGTARDSSDLTVSGATVNVPAGLYSSAASKSVASGTAGTPTASKGAVSNNSVTVTPSVTNTEGYITGGTKTGTGVTVSASELVSGNKALTPSTTAQANIDVKNYATASVAAITKELLASLDTDFVAENIKKDVDLFGLLGTLEGGGDFNVSAFYGASKATSGQFTVASDRSGITIYHELGVPPKLFAVYPSEDSLASILQATGQRYTVGGMFISSKFVNSDTSSKSFYGTDIIVAQINMSKSSSTAGYFSIYESGAIGATGRTIAYEIGSKQYNPLYSSSGTNGSFTGNWAITVEHAIQFSPYAWSQHAYLLGGTTWNWIAVG